jgi:hypothetical protein
MSKRLTSPSPSEPTRVVYKFATGEPIPPGATYLSTVTQTTLIHEGPLGKKVGEPCWRVWHYFLVEIEPKEST